MASMPNCSSAELHLRVAWGDLPFPPTFSRSAQTTRIKEENMIDSKSIFVNPLMSNLTACKDQNPKKTTKVKIPHPSSPHTIPTFSFQVSWLFHWLFPPPQSHQAERKGVPNPPRGWRRRHPAANCPELSKVLAVASWGFMLPGYSSKDVTHPTFGKGTSSTQKIEGMPAGRG